MSATCACCEYPRSPRAARGCAPEQLRRDPQRRGGDSGEDRPPGPAQAHGAGGEEPEGGTPEEQPVGQRAQQRDDERQLEEPCHRLGKPGGAHRDRTREPVGGAVEECSPAPEPAHGQQERDEGEPRAPRVVERREGERVESRADAQSRRAGEQTQHPASGLDRIDRGLGCCGDHGGGALTRLARCHGSTSRTLEDRHLVRPGPASKTAAGCRGRPDRCRRPARMATERQREVRRRRKRRNERVKVRQRELAKEKHRQRAAKKS